MAQTKHGEAKLQTPEYTTWQAMRRRCNGKSSKAYPYYGGKGIKVCRRWGRYTCFLKDMGRRPSAEHSLDRIDGTKGYSPENCRWATKREQGLNKVNLRFLTIDGEQKCITEWSETSGVPRGSIFNRLRRGWPEKDAVFQPVVKGRRFMQVSTSSSVVRRHKDGGHSRRCGGMQCRYA